MKYKPEICEVCREKLANHDDETPCDKIAAAPDLLEAAKRVIANWEHGDLAAAVRGLAAAIKRTAP